jgi:hypothetical protein
MLTIKQLVQYGLIPKTGYKMGKSFPEGFELPKEVSNNLWKKLPLFIQVRYEYTPVNGSHSFKG